MNSVDRRELRIDEYRIEVGDRRMEDRVRLQINFVQSMKINTEKIRIFSTLNTSHLLDIIITTIFSKTD